MQVENQSQPSFYVTPRLRPATPPLANVTPYLVIVRQARETHKAVPKNALRGICRKIGLAASAGILLGFAAAAVGSNAGLRRSATKEPPPTADNSRVLPPAVLQSTEIERLRVRNRRLEALVTVLRERGGSRAIEVRLGEVSRQ